MNVNIDIDKQINPIKNFYLYVNNKWEETTTIPNDESEWGTFSIVHEETQKKIITILNKLSISPTEKYHLIGGLFKKIMEISSSENNLIINRLRDYIKIFNKVKTMDDMGEILGSLVKMGIEPFFSLGALEDPKNSKIVTLSISYPSLSLPEREYYLDEKLSEYTQGLCTNIELFLKYCQSKHLIEFDSDDTIKKTAKKIINIETLMAKIIKPIVERRNVEKLYFKTTIEGFIDNMNNVGDKIPFGDDIKTIDNELNKRIEIMWKRFFANASLNTIQDIIVYDISYIRKITVLLSMYPIEDLILFVKYKIIKDLGQGILDDMDVINFEFFGKILQGQTVIADRTKRITNLIISLFGEIIGEEYIKNYIDLNCKKDIESIIDNIKEQLRDSLIRSTWMCEATKEQALLKLKKFKARIACPDKWRDYSNLIKNIGDFKLFKNRGSIFDVVIMTRIHNYHINVIECIDKEPDDNVWKMNVFEVNAYYDPLKNEMFFPAGILQKPFFDKDNSLFENYGGIGTIIGHELTHGYDDQGSKQDYKGELKNWWTSDDLKKFNIISKKVSEQYSSYKINGNHINGLLTLGENMADLGGVVLAYRAMLSECDKQEIKIELDDKQIFFISYANLWKKKTRPEKTLARILSDPHSPSMFRVFILRNIDEFYQAFEEKQVSDPWAEDTEENNMYLEKSKRIKFW